MIDEGLKKARLAIAQYRKEREQEFPLLKKIRKYEETISKKDLELRWNILEILNRWRQIEWDYRRFGWNLDKLQESAKKDMHNLLKLATIEKIKKVIPFEWDTCMPPFKKPFRGYYESYLKKEKMLACFVRLETKADMVRFKKENK